jgi:hypothetical protein
MHWIFEKVNIKGYVLQNLISFYFFDQELSLGTKNHFASIKRKKKKNNSTPSTSSKCSSLTTKPMMLKFEENPLHLLNKNYFKFDTNPMVDLGGTTI